MSLLRGIKYKFLAKRETLFNIDEVGNAYYIVI